MAVTTAPTSPRPQQVRASGGGFPGALAAEWTKLWGLRSTWICLALALFAGVGVAFMGAYSMQQGDMSAGMDANALTPTVIMLPQFALITLASLLITGEYATGSIRTTFTTVPRRTTAFAAKALVLAVVAVTAGALIGLASALINMALFGSEMDLTSAGLAHGIGGTAVYCVAISMFVLGLGAVLRSTAGTVATTIAVLMGIPMVASIVGNKVLTTISEYSPTSASASLIGATDQVYAWPTALLVLAAWAVGGLAAGFVLLRGRDA